MARILSLEECSIGLRNILLKTLRVEDEATLLPQASASLESGIVKNCVYKLSGVAPNPPVDIFSTRWFDGITAVLLDDRDVVPLITNPDRRAQLLAKLAEQIKSEICDSSVSVGPALDADDLDRDVDKWDAGFDSTTACVGIFVSEHVRAPATGVRGVNRVHRESYLVCRAGGGVAASTFHARLMGSISKGKTLSQALETGSEPGPQGLRRVASAGTRNRCRILLKAAEIIGLRYIETIADQASPQRDRAVVPTVDVHVNSMRLLENTDHMFQYATAVDCVASQGLITCSNIADGFVLFCSKHQGPKVVVRNEASSCVPFGTERLLTNRAMSEHVLAEMLKNKACDVHVDKTFVRSRFAWRNRDLGPSSQSVFPFCLWGTHNEENFTSSFGRELGTANLTACRLHPEVVLVAGVDVGKLRPMVRELEATRD
jgi:hypothetical protein